MGRFLGESGCYLRDGKSTMGRFLAESGCCTWGNIDWTNANAHGANKTKFQIQNSTTSAPHDPFLRTLL